MVPEGVAPDYHSITTVNLVGIKIYHRTCVIILMGGLIMNTQHCITEQSLSLDDQLCSLDTQALCKAQIASSFYICYNNFALPCHCIQAQVPAVFTQSSQPHGCKKHHLIHKPVIIWPC